MVDFRSIVAPTWTKNKFYMAHKSLVSCMKVEVLRTKSSGQPFLGYLFIIFSSAKNCMSNKLM